MGLENDSVLQEHSVMVDYAGAIVEWSGGTATLLERMKQWMDITDDTQDADLSLWLDLAGRACEKYIDNKIVSQEVTEFYAMSKTPIDLRYYPAADVTSVLIDGGDDTASWELFTTDGITWAASNRHSASRVDYFNQLSITYTAGYDPVPSDLGYVLVSTAIAYGEQTTGTGTIKKEVVNGVGSVEYAVSDDAAASVGLISSANIGVLDRYRRLHV